MAISPINFAIERLRQEASQDSNFYKQFVYYFELEIPEDLANAAFVSNKFIIPLVIAPTNYVLEEPFTVEVTPTQGGGVYVEENGIIQRTIRLSGNTGFRPRGLVGGFSPSLPLLTASPEKKSYSRELPWALSELSGHRHFQFLQDALFRTYADLKRDPATAEETRMMFHNPKDDEHWLVIPRNFVLERDASRPHLYNYNIDLLAVDKAEDADADFSEDQSLLDAIKNAMRMVQAVFDMIAGAINDLTALVGELTNLVKNFAKIIDSITSIKNAIGNFLDGVTELIESPYAVINSINELLGTAQDGIEAQEASSDNIQTVPPGVRNKLRQLEDGMDLLGMHPQLFETSAQKELRRTRESQELVTATSQERREEAAAGSAPTTLQDSANQGTALSPGDVQSAKAQLSVGRNVTRYTGAREVALGQGDTLVNLAARFLGDARQWQHIAVLNGMKPPFINDQAFTDLQDVLDDDALPGTGALGQNLLIPNFSKPPNRQPLLPILGVRSEEPSANHLLGSDLSISLVPGTTARKPLYDVDIDFELGATDVKLKSGVDNLAQAIITRLTTEKGTDILYKRLGLARMVGMNIAPVDLEITRFRVAEALVQDPRIARVRKTEFSQVEGQEDSLVVNVEVEIRGYAESETVKAIL